MLPNGRNPAVSVAIAAFNAESNIAALLQSILGQRTGAIEIQEIIVHSDCSADRTAAIARECKDPRVMVIEQPVRRGFAAAVGTICATFSGDALVLLNDDIRIAGDRFIEAAVVPIFDQGADLVGINTQPLPPRTFIESAYVSVFNVWKRIREALPDRNNVFTCDGAALCLSAHFARSVDLLSDVRRAGNVDTFLYFSCLAWKLQYVHAVDALAYYRSPATLKDYLARYARNESQPFLLEKYFGSLVAGQYRLPAGLYWKSAFREALSHPLASLFVFAAAFYIRTKARRLAENSTPTWETLQSSKNLD
jgi:glycosyltransferase involved in cell wall biosynthesis